MFHATEIEQENSLTTSCTEEDDETIRMILTLFMIAAVVFALAVGQDVNAQTSGVEVITRSKAELAGVEGKKSLRLDDDLKRSVRHLITS